MRPIRTLTALLLGVAAHAVPAMAADGFRVIVHPDVQVRSLSRTDLSRLFLKKTTQWADGTAVRPVDRDRKSDVRAAFSRAVHEKSPDAVSAFWQVAVFSGRATPPPVRSSDADVIEYVRSTPGAVGYVGDGPVVTGVRVLSILPAGSAPADP